MLRNFGGVDANNFVNLLSVDDQDLDSDVSPQGINNCSLRSSYYDSDNLNTILDNGKLKFSFMSSNIQSINTSFSELGLFIDGLKNILDFRYSVLCFQECQLASVDFNSFELDGYKLHAYHKTCGSKGGLLTYCLNDFESEILDIAPKTH